MSSDTPRLRIRFRNEDHEVPLETTATVEALSLWVEDTFNIPAQNQKYMLPKLLLKPLDKPSLLLSEFPSSKPVKLIGTEGQVVDRLNSTAEQTAQLDARRRERDQRLRSSTARRRPPPTQSTPYTFADVRPLQFLPHPERSLAMLNRLKNDPGIRHVMAKHKFSVGLLTEMEPLSNMNVSLEGTSRLLGLNRNQGEVIELRLRTDAYDGYRDYRTVRKTLCHELTHNVHGPHDRKFWDLCHQIEREVEGSSGGQTLEGAHSSVPEADEEADICDHGGWTGGTYVVGGGGSSSNAAGLSRREIIARALDSRLKGNKDDARKPNDSDDQPGQPTL